ncbi:6-bladed beta-propeller [Candidatus Palauibacter sp.]|uniref:6-bladed beta-propeller n=1 Tax=Candidatus Palauibacter sp. TaxID=3101350 RepID=UPI003B01FE77
MKDLPGQVGTSGLALIVVTALAGCETSAREGGAAVLQVDTLRDGRILVTNPTAVETPPVRPPTLVEDLRIGSVDDPCSAFGQAFSLAVDDNGRIYVADLQTNDIRVFSPEGACLRTFGGAGDGPGEFSMLAGIAWQRPGFLWAMDALHHRLTVFDSLGNALEAHGLGRPMGASLPWPMWVDADANLHVWNQGERRIDKYGPGPALTALGAFPVPAVELEWYSRIYGDGRAQLQELSPIPHSPQMESTVDREGEVWLANEATFDLHEVSYAGDTLRTVRLLRPAPRLEGRERDSLAVATGLDERRLPDHKPVLEDVNVSADGWIWVTTDEGAIEAWDVFDAGGVYQGVVVPPVPIEPKPFPVFGRGTITAVTKGALDLQYVVRLRVTR